MIVDFHSHDFPDALAARAIAGMCRKTEGFLYPAGDGTLENHLDSMRLAGIDKAVLCQISTRPEHHAPLLRRARAIMDGEFGERARRMIIPFCSAHPADPDVAGHLREIRAAGVKGIKVHPYYQGFSLADPAVFPMFRAAADLGLVVTTHAGFDVGYPARRDACGPREIAILLRNVPGLKFVASHLGGCAGYAPHSTDELLELGCWIDTSALHRDWHKDEQIRLLRSWPSDRILFGTDFPWTDGREAVRWVSSIRAKEDLEALFSKNAERLLG